VSVPAGFVVLIFTDLVGSTQLLDRLGDDAAEEVLRTHLSLLRQVVADSGGHEVKSLGDGLMVVFPSALQALGCAVAMQRAVAEQRRHGASHGLELRVGVHAGEPVQDDDDFFGTAVVVAKRLCDLAQGGEILASDLVAGLLGSRGGFRFRPVGPLHLKGLARPLAAVAVEWESAERAAELLLQARDIYRALGLESVAETLSTLVAEVGGHGPMPASAARPEQTPHGRANVFRREGEYWFIVYEGDAFRLRDAKGLRYLARLLASPGREIHALDLVAEEAEPAPAGSSRALGAEGAILHVAAAPGTFEVLDAAARAAYRRRLAELQDDLEEAEAFHDPERAARAREEMEALAAALAGAVGLGGRSRWMGSPAERARQATTKALKAALGKIARYSPALGRHLASTVRTGTYCRYEPDPRLPIAWKL
jgi:class 3 adenylate cyclase